MDKLSSDWRPMEYYNDSKQTVSELTLRYRDSVKSFCTQTVELWKVAASTAFLTGLMFCILILWLVLGGLGRQQAFSALPLSTESSAHDNLEQAIKILYHPILHGYDGDFTTIDGKTFSTASNNWNASLGNDLCIIDVDSRPMNGSDQVWSPGEAFDWSHVKGSQSGYFNHYIYSRIHGYRYIYSQATVPEGWEAPWARSGVFLHHLQDCRLMMYADSDVIIPNLRLPIEWLLNHWDVPNDKSTLAMSQDPIHVPGIGLKLTDSKGNQGNNAGFIILYNNGDGVLKNVLTKWANCPSEVDYPGCAKFRSGWPAEQGAFNEYVRHDFPEYVHSFPCAEAMGWPDWDVCQGSLIRHYAMAKNKVHGGIESSLAQGLMKVVHENMVNHKSELFEFQGFIEGGDAEEHSSSRRWTGET